MVIGRTHITTVGVAISGWLPTPHLSSAFLMILSSFGKMSLQKKNVLKMLSLNRHEEIIERNQILGCFLKSCTHMLEVPKARELAICNSTNT